MTTTSIATMTTPPYPAPSSVDGTAAPEQPGAAIVACLLYVLPGCDLVDNNQHIVIEDDGDY